MAPEYVYARQIFSTNSIKRRLRVVTHNAHAHGTAHDSVLAVEPPARGKVSEPMLGSILCFPLLRAVGTLHVIFLAFIFHSEDSQLFLTPPDQKCPRAVKRICRCVYGNLKNKERAGEVVFRDLSVAISVVFTPKKMKKTALGLSSTA